MKFLPIPQDLVLGALSFRLSESLLAQSGRDLTIVKHPESRSTHVDFADKRKPMYRPSDSCSGHAANLKASAGVLIPSD